MSDDIHPLKPSGIVWYTKYVDVDQPPRHPQPPLIPPAELHLMRLIHEHGIPRRPFVLSPITPLEVLLWGAHVDPDRVERDRRFMDELNENVIQSMMMPMPVADA